MSTPAMPSTCNALHRVGDKRFTCERETGHGRRGHPLHRQSVGPTQYVGEAETMVRDGQRYVVWRDNLNLGENTRLL